MQVFISWSGQKSHDVADLLDSWIQCVLQAVQPWMSSKDIDRGAIWFSEISDQLKDTKIGIVCLTRANKEKPWILFEAGALAKGLNSSRVCTFLVDLDSTDLGNPLAQFNHTSPTRESVFDLVRTLNSALGEKSLKEKVLEQVFDTYWPQFESRMAEILAANYEPVVEVARTEEDVLVEVLQTVRSMDRRIRNLEVSPSHLNETRRASMHPKMVREEVKRHLAQGMPPEVVEDVLHGAAPRPLLRRWIMECLESNDSGQQGDD